VKLQHHHQKHHHHHKKTLQGFNVTLIDDSGHFVATPIPSKATVPAGVIPQWTSSDILIATVPTSNPDPTGLTTTATAVSNGTIGITIAATLSNGQVVQGTITVTVLNGKFS